MSLRTLVASFDDDALVALANKGLLRRAIKAVEQAKLVHFRDDDAKVLVDGHHVLIPASGPQSATCNCPAPGMCSHILTAMLVLRNVTDAEPSAPIAPHSAAPSLDEASPKVGAIDWMVALDAQTLRKFAGADYPGATNLAATAIILDRAATAQINFTSPEASVTFVSEQPLKDALYKGPGSRKRLVITAAALAVRDREGVARDALQDTVAQEQSAALTDATLSDISAAIEAAIAQVFLGSPTLAQERLLDLAISAKVQSAPRLTSQLLTLSSQAGWADTGDIRFEGGRFLAALAQTYALVIGLRQRPLDPDLLGIARRIYEPVPDMDLWSLGAKGWTTPNGARGLTLYLLNPDTGGYHAATVARAAGMDATFTPSRAYAGPIWGATSFAEFTGKEITLDAPHLANDGQLSTSTKTIAKIHGPLSSKEMREATSVYNDWEKLLADLRSRVGTGLSRAATPLPSLIAPISIDEAQFDDIAQLYRWQARDRSGNVLSLSAHSRDVDHLKSLHTQFPGAVALLVISSITADELRHDPVTLLRPMGEGISATNLDFQPAPDGKLIVRVKRGLQRGFRKLQGGVGSSPQAGFASQVLAKLAEQCRHHQPDTLAALAKTAEARQLLLLADSLEKLITDPDPSSILAAAYLSHNLILSDSLNCAAV
ncbi:hypothetical protein SAMN04488030_2398 [Aliiroseovarius halocynthiae]|uniref:SWIM-type domain-containing protein n=1 Tax=Aliiroseovarius halocynthiae TaxID=985055 RepID=A0A545SQG5_9RHOB|nr:hypothetical protein [Aliiroseovarius halocynthiae]TQV67208.1 hypothetical protein FIL88_11555 [Aliiroseovarius halocynthiae]SMR82059.1 hypothetical protein SAMN04488030_2398 [Aliiroseovarius halocynthiae]